MRLHVPLKTVLVALAAWVGLCVAVGAQAQDTRSAVRAAEARAVTLTEWADTLAKQADTDGSIIDPIQAQLRYEQALYESMLGNDERAAQDLLVLAHRLETGPLRWDIQWSLVESLSRAELNAIALTAVREILGEPDHPYRQHAAMRELELLGRVRADAQFIRAYTAYADAGLLRDPTQFRYFLGRAHLMLGDFEAATQVLSEVEQSHSDYSRAIYLLGAMAVMDGALDRALPRFQQAAAHPSNSEQQSHVRDMALLALARIAFEQQDYDRALTWYDKVPATSPEYNTALTESIWVSVRQGDNKRALEVGELYLTHFPDDAESARLRLIQGHLKMQQEDWTGAEEAYATLVARFARVDMQVADLQRISPDEVSLVEVEGAPPWVLAMWASEDSVQRAGTAMGTLERQGNDLSEATSMLHELERRLRRTPTIYRHARIYEEAAAARHELAGLQLGLLQLRQDRIGGLAGPVRRAVSDLSSEHERLVREWRDLTPESDPTVGSTSTRWDALETLQRDSLEHARLLDALDGGGRDTPLHEAWRQAWYAVDTAQDRLGDAVRQVRYAQATLVPTLEHTLISERDQLHAIQSDHREVLAAGSSLWQIAASHGQDEVSAFIHDARRDAMAGIADSNWARLVAVRADIDETTTERKADLRDLERLFAELEDRTVGRPEAYADKR